MFSESTWLETGLALVRMSVAGTLWLTLGAFLLLTIREPVRRTQACGLILLGSLLIPLLAFMFPGNLWEPPAPLQVDISDVVTNRKITETPRASLDRSPFVPQRRVRLSVPTAEPDVLEQTGLIDDSTEEALFSRSAQRATDVPAKLVSEADRSGSILRSPTEAAFSWWGLLSAAYFVGAGSAALWYIAGLAGLARLVRGAVPPSSSLESVWQAVRGDDLALTPLLVSGHLRQPIACWWRRAIVLLPAAWDDIEPGRVEAALAHEAEHIRRNDFWWWQGANLARIVFWFHPLAWWLRRELRIGQDFLADAAVVQSERSRADYAEFLTASACRDLRPISLVGLGLIGGRSELYRRVAMLLKHERPLEIRAPRWWNAALLAGGVLTLGALTTMRVVADPSPKPTAPVLPGPAVDVLPSLSRAANEQPPAANGSNPFAAEVPSAAAPADVPGVDPFAAAASGGRPSLAQSPAGPFGEAKRESPKEHAPMPPGGGTVIRKLAIQNGTVEPEPGVSLSIVWLTDPTGVAWKPDGSRLEAEGGDFGASAFGGGGMPGGYPGAGMGPSSMMPPGGGDSILTEARQRNVVVQVQRPLPAGLNLSVDGQSISRVSTALPDSKARQITQTAFWPDEQMEGSVGVRFASKTVVLELVASKRDGETIKSKEGGLEASLGPWRQGGDLQTEIVLDGVQPNDPRFVIVAQAVDVEGTTHPGRIEQRRRGGLPGSGGAYGAAMGPGMEGSMGEPGGGRSEWLMVFPHLPADRIAKVRLTWHPYAWVIFRNVSLEPDHKTTPTAELYVDPSKPEDLPEMAEELPAAPLDVSSLRSI